MYITFKIWYVDSQEVSKIVQHGPVYPSPISSKGSIPREVQYQNQDFYICTTCVDMCNYDCNQDAELLHYPKELTQTSLFSHAQPPAFYHPGLKIFLEVFFGVCFVCNDFHFLTILGLFKFSVLYWIHSNLYFLRNWSISPKWSDLCV